MSIDSFPGIVVRSLSGFYTVETGQGPVTARLRGRLKKGPFLGDIVAVGDRVRVSVQPDGTGMVESVEPRKSALTRMAPTARGMYEQVLLANPDQVVLVFACARPEPHLRMLDRFLVITEKQDIPTLIVANKVDLVGLERARELFSIYPPIGYEVIYTSAKTGEGLETLRAHLAGKESALAGPSGVGKSSLLNALQPGLGLIVREVSEGTEKGRHTTQVRQMYPLAGDFPLAGDRPLAGGSPLTKGGYVTDLPGLRSLSLWDTEPEELDGYFREIAPLVEYCQFNDCTHQNEPGCAVRAAVEDGRVSPERYESYLRLRFGEEE